MKILQLRILFLTFLLVPLMIQAQKETASDISIIPQPQQIESKDGLFQITGTSKIIVCSDNKEAFKIADDLAQKINNLKYYRLKAEKGEKPGNLANEIIFLLSDNIEKYGKEGYKLDVSPNGIRIEAHQPNGLFYAVQSLYQLLPPDIFSGVSVGNLALVLPCVNIYDYPRFEWRGQLLDPSRHFISTDFIKQNLDYLASLKMNRFHWHLTDDQGWRIEIKAYPKLTEIGAWRVDRSTEPWPYRPEQNEDEIPTYGGFYTQDEIQEIIQYARDRYIEIIPEIDMPGHSRSAIAAYPEISCDHADYKVATGGIMENNTYCPGKEITFEFTEKMLKEVIDLFPYDYIHIGGDECNKEHWQQCSDCQQRIKDNNLKDEVELQSYFIKRVEKIINKHGKKMIGWDEILEGGLAPNASVMSWRGTQGGIEAAKAGHDVIMSPWGYCYLDLRQGDIELEPDYGYGKLLLSTAYSFNPVPEELTMEESSHILGVQGNLWGESMQKPFDHNYMLFPRLFAIAEVGWTLTENKDYNNFIDRTEFAFNRLNAMKVNYAPSMYNVSLNHGGSLQTDDLMINLYTDAGNGGIHFTTDGSEPNYNSKLFEEAFPVKESMIIKARVYKDGMALGRLTTKNIQIHKAAGKKTIYLTPPNEKYNTSDRILTDCLRGTLEHSKKHWAAFRNSDLDLIIDLGNETEITKITASFLHSTRSWIFLPLNVTFEVSTDGEKYQRIQQLDLSETALKEGKFIKEVPVTFEKEKVRYIKLKAEGVKINPEWHHASGGKNWIFIDEIMVN